MSPSRPFILRPVATSLLMAAILLVGIVAYRQLPVSALPEVDYPTIEIVTLYPGAAPDVMASSVTAPLERQFGQIPGLKQMTSTSSFGSSVVTLQFDLKLDIDVAEQEVQAAINAGSTFLPTDLPNPPIYTKSNPADAPVLTLALTSSLAPAAAGAVAGRYAPGAQDLAAPGRRPRHDQRRAEAGRSRSRESDRAGGLRLEPDVGSAGDPERQREHGQRILRRTAPGVHDWRQRSADVQQGLPIGHRGLPQRRSGPALGRGRRHRRCREHEAGSVGEPDACGCPEHSAAARRQHHHRRRQHQGAHSPADGRPAVLDLRLGPDRSDHHHSRLRPRRPVRAHFDRRSRGDGDLPVPAHLRDDDHSRDRRPAVARRHVRRDVSARLQLEQPHADGAHDLHGVRGGRRHRDDREHRALRRGRRAAAGCGLEGRRPDRIHDRVAHGVAHCCADSVALHGRHRRTPVPRVCDYPRGFDSGVGSRLADPHTDDVRAVVAARARGARGPAGACVRASLQRLDRTIFRIAAMGTAAPDADAPGVRGVRLRRRYCSTSSCRRDSSLFRIPG